MEQGRVPQTLYNQGHIVGIVVARVIERVFDRASATVKWIPKILLQFFDIGFHIATNPALALGFFKLALVVLDEIWDGGQAGRHTAIPHQ